jgi:hypothetical protein
MVAEVSVIEEIHGPCITTGFVSWVMNGCCWA